MEKHQRWGFRKLPESGLSEGATRFCFDGVDAEGKVFDLASPEAHLPAGWGEAGSVAALQPPPPAASPIPTAESSPGLETTSVMDQGDERAALAAKASSLGVDVNPRWGVAKLRRVIAEWEAE
jgi:hypothetical protein